MSKRGGREESAAKRQRLVEEFNFEFAELPLPAKIEFMTLSEPEDIIAVCSVSKSFRAFCNNDNETQAFWKAQIGKLGRKVTGERLQTAFPNAKSWFQVFLEQNASNDVDRLARLAERQIDD